MNTSRAISSPGCRQPRSDCGYLLTEALVYIGLVFVVLAVGYIAAYRCIDQSVLLRRNSDDITAALHAGERWRADVRACREAPRLASESGKTVLRLTGPGKEIDYAFADGVVQRRVDSGQWSPLLDHVASSQMTAENRDGVAAWRWELELQPRRKGSVAPSRIRPLFTFLAVPQSR